MYIWIIFIILPVFTARSVDNSHICNPGEEGFSDCESKSARCVPALNEEPPYRCDCGPYKALSIEKICVDHDVCSLNSHSYEICSAGNAECQKDQNNKKGYICICRSGEVINDYCQESSESSTDFTEQSSLSTNSKITTVSITTPEIITTTETTQEINQSKPISTIIRDIVTKSTIKEPSQTSTEDLKDVISTESSKITTESEPEKITVRDIENYTTKYTKPDLNVTSSNNEDENSLESLGKNESEKVPYSLILGVIVGGLLLLAGFVIVAAYFRRKVKFQKSDSKDNLKTTKQLENKEEKT